MAKNCFPICLLLMLYVVSGCSTANKKEMTDVLNSYSYDQQVIEKLPLYDSLAVFIIQRLPVFQQTIDSNDGYRAFRYMPGYNETAMFNKLPQDIRLQIDQSFNKLGKNFIYGLVVFNDSSIKIQVRLSEGQKALVNIEDNLSYYPEGAIMRKNKFPIKDTVLNKNWQYWVRVDDQEFFQ